MSYKIDEETFTGALAKLVERFKAENPGVGKFKATCHDGSTVVIVIRDKEHRDGRPKIGDVRTWRGVREVLRPVMADLGGGEYAECVTRGKTRTEWVPEADHLRWLEGRKLLLAWKDVQPGTRVAVCRDDGHTFSTVTRSAPWMIGGFYGTPVIDVAGISGCYRLSRVAQIDEVAPPADHTETSEVIDPVETTVP